jgi:hypothetical protein
MKWLDRSARAGAQERAVALRGPEAPGRVCGFPRLPLAKGGYDFGVGVV